MSTSISRVQAPRGIARRLYRLPIWLFRLHLEWLLLKHFLLLTHTGRSSGLPRQTVLEIIHHDPKTERYVVFAGWGKQSDWVKNTEKTPQVIIQVGSRPFLAQAVHLSSEETQAIVLAYARRYPHLMPILLRLLLGYRMESTEEGIRDLARKSTLIAFEVRAPQIGLFCQR